MNLDRRQILSYDRVIKTRAWTSVLLVNPKGDAEVNGLLAFCRNLQVTLVWDPEFRPPKAAPTESMRRAAVLARLLVTAKANPRLQVFVGAPVEVAAQLLLQQQFYGPERLPPFSGAILPQLDDPAQLRAWGTLVDPQGALIGRQHGDGSFRAGLARAGLVRQLGYGVWMIDIKSMPGLPSAPEAPATSPPRADRVLPAPPPNHRRTRPVWETLSEHLGPTPGGH